MSKRYLVLDIGGTFVKYAIMDGDAQIELQGKVPARTGSEAEMLEVLEQIKGLVGTDYESVAISMPGRVDFKTGIAHMGGAYDWIRDYPVTDRYGAVFGKRATAMNDGKCAAMAERWRGALADVSDGAVLVLGTGVGGGIVIDNRVYMGALGGAGELSGLVADFDSIKDGVGFSSPWMWSARVSAGAITKNYAKAKSLETADGVMLFDAYEAGEKEAREVVDEFGKQLAAGIMSLQSVLDLPRYAIGGGISARPVVIEVVRDALDALLDPIMGFAPFCKPQIVSCRFGNEANLIGALAFHLGLNE